MPTEQEERLWALLSMALRMQVVSLTIIRGFLENGRVREAIKILDLMEATVKETLAEIEEQDA